MVLVMVFLAYRQDVPLVSDDYYEQELKYQDEIDMMNNASRLAIPLGIEYSPDKRLLTIRYSPGNTGRISGTIQFMRPSDPKLDINFNISVNDRHEQELSTASMAKGLWKMKVYWENAGIKYLLQQDIIL